MGRISCHIGDGRGGQFNKEEWEPLFDRLARAMTPNEITLILHGATELQIHQCMPATDKETR